MLLAEAQNEDLLLSPELSKALPMPEAEENNKEGELSDEFSGSPLRSYTFDVEQPRFAFPEMREKLSQADVK